MSCLEAALAYLREGRSVIPVRTWELDAQGKANKKPCVAWQKYTKTLPTEAEVRLWWQQWPEAGVAVITGAVSNLVVVDLDARNGADLDVTLWVDTYTVTSPGGMHLWYSHPGEPVDCSAGKLGPGVDVRGDGGYIIAPPTVRVDGGAYAVGDPCPLAPYPYCAPEPITFDTSAEEDSLASLMANGAPEGQRNSTLAKLAGSLAGKHVQISHAMALLATWGTTQCSPPMTREEVREVVEKIYKREKVKVEQDNQKKAPDESAISLLRFVDFAAKYAGDVEWLIEGWVPKASVGMIASPPECYKSWLTGELAVSVATGAKFLDSIPVAQTGPVIVLQLEDGFSTTANRYSLQIAAKYKRMGDERDGEFVFGPEGIDDLWITESRDFSFERPEAVAQLRRIVEEIRPVLVIIDPLNNVVSLQDHSVMAARQLKVLKHLRDEFGTCFLLVHHATKSNILTFDRERSLGSQFLNAFVEYGAQIRKPDDGVIIAKRHFKDAETPAAVEIDWQIKTNGEEFSYTPRMREVGSDELDEIVKDYNAKRSGKEQKKEEFELDDGGWAKVKEAVSKGFETPNQIADHAGVPLKRVRELLKALQADGAIAKTGGRWTLA